MGTILFGTVAFVYYFFPYVTGRMYNETLGKIHFILSFVGTVMVFFTQHILESIWNARRIYDYPAIPEWVQMNIIISIGAFIIGISMAIFLWNLIWSSAKGKPADMDDPFGLGGKCYFPYQAKNPHH